MSNPIPEEVREAAIAAVRPFLKTLVGIGIPDVTPTDAQIGKAIDAALSALEAAGWVCVKADAVNEAMVGGNHLASVLGRLLGGNFSEQYPPDTPPLAVLGAIGSGTAFDVWSGWAPLMRLRAALLTASNPKEKPMGSPQEASSGDNKP